MSIQNKKLKTSELGRPTVAEYSKATKIPVIVILDNIRSLHNIGSVFRTADAFRIEAIWLCGFTAKPPHREIQKTALGATETVSWKYFPTITETIVEFEKTNYDLYSAEQATKSIPLEKFSPDSKTGIGIVFGNEVSGVQQEFINRSKGVIEISQEGTKHSLNVSVAAGIVLYHLFLKFR